MPVWSLWRAEVRLQRWNPRLEVTYRRLLPAKEALHAVVHAEPPMGPLYRRVFVEAGVVSADCDDRPQR